MNRKQIAGMLLSALASVSSAQTYSVSEYSIELEYWSFTPVLVDVGGVRTTHAFLALRESSTLVGDNLASVLYVRNSTMPGGWETLSWATQDQWSAIEWVKAEFSIPSTEDLRWQTTQARPATPISDDPVTYQDGLLEGDLFAPILAVSPDPDAVIDMLVALGYSAGDVPVDNENEGTCTSTPHINIPGFGIDAAEAGQDGLAAMLEAMDFCVFCIPWTFHSPPFWPPNPCAAPGGWGVTQTSPTGRIICTYTRTMTCTQMRMSMRVKLDCSTTQPCSQSRTITYTQVEVCDDTGTLYPAGTCPPNPSCFSGGFNSNSTMTTSGWAPPCP